MPKATPPHVQCCQVFKRRKGPEGAASSLGREAEAAFRMPATSTGSFSMLLPSTLLKRSMEAAAAAAAASAAAPTYDLEQQGLANDSNAASWPLLPSHAARLVDEHALHPRFLLPQPSHNDAGQAQVNQSVWHAQQGIATQQFQELGYQQLLALQQEGGQLTANGAKMDSAGILLPLHSQMIAVSSPDRSSADTVCDLPCEVKPPTTHAKASTAKGAKGAKQQQVGVKLPHPKP